MAIRTEPRRAEVDEAGDAAPDVGGAGTRRERLAQRLVAPVDGASLAFFRIVFGLIVVWEVFTHLDRGWPERFYSAPDFHFTYWPFDFVSPWPGDGMLVHYWVLGAAAALVALGLFYRAAATTVFFGITYLFLLDKTQYLNHIYLVCLLAFLMIFLPAHRTFSLDARRRREVGSAVVPAWSLWLLRFQLGVVYVFAGVAKLNGDWFGGEPLRTWLADATDFPLIGSLFTNDAVVWTMVFGALAVDLLAVPALLWRPTRVPAFALVVVFHTMNSRLFDIGIFPWLMIAATALFFAPSWPRKLVRDGGAYGSSLRFGAFLAGFVLGALVAGLIRGSFSPVMALFGGTGVGVLAYHAVERFVPAPEPLEADAQRKRRRKPRRRRDEPDEPAVPVRRRRGLLVGALAVWMVVQLAVPLRHFAIPGDAAWSEEGHRFSWRMMTRQKNADSFFFVTDPATGERWHFDLAPHLTRQQYFVMSARPDMILQFAHRVEDILRDEGRGDVEVRVRAASSLNGREPQLLIDPEVDLTEVDRPWMSPADWILPLEPPVPADLDDLPAPGERLASGSAPGSSTGSGE